MNIRGRVWRFGNDVSTDVIAPGKYLRLSAAEIAGHVMEGIDPNFAKQVRPGDIILAGRNFGCGSSRENAPDALRLAGISVVVAESFGRIFFRNCINLGLPALDCKCVDEIAEGNLIEIDLEEGRLTDLTGNQQFSFQPLPSHLIQMLEAGGLVPFLEQRIAAEEAVSNDTTESEQAVA